MVRTLARAAALALAVPTIVAGAPPAPAGPHPRLFLGGPNLGLARSNAAAGRTASRAVLARCQETIDSPKDYTARGGADGDTWPGAAVACAFAYLVTQDAAKQAAYLTQAVKYWTASLNDDQSLGDGLGCTPARLAQWDGSAPSGVVVTVTHDTGYPMRWYGPYIALTYDWLHDVADARVANLLPQTRGCLTAWVDHYTASGYHNDEPGANYNAGFVAGKTLAAVAIGTENGDGGRLWTETVDGLFGQLLVGKGLAGLSGALGSPAGVMVGGDWGEGWQYGPLSVLEYAASARVVEENGAPLPEMDAWTDSLVVRYVHATVPTLDGQWVGGDFDSDQVYQSPTMNQLDAVLLGPSSDAAAGWAGGLKALQSPPASSFIWNALAELRSVAPADYRQQTPAPALWYVARGTRALYARTSWDTNAFWAVLSSPPEVNSDHHHFAAGNFVFSRGGDHLVVDPSNYGEPGTLETNAVAADSPGVTGTYAPSQTPWSQAELPWVRATDGAVYAARADLAGAFAFSGTPSDIPYAHREWTFLPEGEIVTIDRVHTADASRSMYLHVHTNTGGTLALSAQGAVGAVGSSKVAIHPLLPTGTCATISRPAVTDTYEYPCGSCTNARFAVDDYAVKVAGPWAAAIHVVDGLGASEAPAQVGSLNDDAYDPAPKENGGVMGAAVYRGSKQSYVVASSGVDGKVAGGTMTYGVPGGSAARHVVFDAPEDGSGRSLVTAAASAGRCVVRITAGAGFAGRPLLFSVGPAAGGCAVAEGSDVASGDPPPPSRGSALEACASAGGGCACGSHGARSATLAPLLALCAAALLLRGRTTRARRAP